MSDRRRILGPSNVIVPNIPPLPTTVSPASPSKKPSSAIPPFFLKHGLIKNANGSAYLECNNTIIQVSIFGPRPIRGSFIDRASISVETKFQPHILPQPQGELFNISPNQVKWTGMTHIEQRISNYIETCVLSCLILEKYPKSAIDVNISVISIDEEDVLKRGGNQGLLWLIGWISCCVSLAFVDSGIEMKDLITSGQVKLCGGNKVVIGGNGEEEEEEEDGEGIDALVSFMNLKNDEIVGVWLESNDQKDISVDQTNKAIEECKNMSRTIRANLNSYLLNSF
ncbi:MTR3 [[Candida] subhashii]|uniref:MTR3 n=1 Tax=[Candida] subhashii TaxID=561895 RepID=A0A8J5QPY1_9ASCO|nr:MTR3 [[Candida] subhashii]KAG7663442.1 MTR3 [[Candida] subhashii]